MHRKMATCLIIFLVMTLLYACRTDQINALEAEVFALHDEVMPHLEEMKKQRRALMRSEYNTPTDSVRARQASSALYKADSLMWAWMYQYIDVKQLKDSLSDPQIESYLERQRELAREVNLSIKNAMNQADHILDQLSTDN